MNDDTNGQETDGESADQLRSEYEQFSLAVCRGAVGFVNVRNDSYGDDASSHIYSVQVDDGHTVSCSCPHATHRGAFCKHQRAVDANPLVLTSANVTGGATQVATDGGTTVDQPNEDDDEGETCDRCPTLLADAHDQPAGYTVVTTDDEELCPECADNRSGEEIGFIDSTNDSQSDDSCKGPHYHTDDMCDECTEQSTVDFNEGEVNRGIDTEGCAASDDSTRSENVCLDCGSSYPHGETCDCGGIDVL